MFAAPTKLLSSHPNKGICKDKLKNRQKCEVVHSLRGDLALAIAFDVTVGFSVSHWTNALAIPRTTLLKNSTKVL
jgi:hypothetical protein